MNQLIEKIKRLWKKAFIRDVAVLQTQAIASTLLSIVASVVFARVLGPEKYGAYSLIFAFAGLLGIFINVGISQASLTLLPEAYAKKDKEEIKNISTYFFKIGFLMAGTVGLISIIFAPLISDFFYHDSQIGSLARWILLANIITLSFVFLCTCLQAIRKIKYLAAVEVINNSSQKILPIIFVVFGFGLAGLVWGYFLNALLFLIFSVFAYSILAKGNSCLAGFKEIIGNFEKIKLKKYFNFGFLIAVDKNLGSLMSLLPIFLLGVFAPAQEVGFFKIALAYITIPNFLLGPISRILNVQLPKSKTCGFDLLKKHFFQTSLYGGLISAFLVIPFIILAPWLIKLFYGSAYQASVNLVYYLAILSVCSGFGIGLGSLYMTLNKVKISIILNICQTISMALLILFLVKIYSPLITVVWVLIISGILFLALNFYILKNILKKYEKG